MSLPAAFVSVILIWSTTPLAIKWSALGAGFSFAVFSRMVIGTLLCAALLLVMRVCIDPAEPAQLKPLKHKPQQAFSFSAIDVVADCCRT